MERSELKLTKPRYAGFWKHVGAEFIDSVIWIVGGGALWVIVKILDSFVCDINSIPLYLGFCTIGGAFLWIISWTVLGWAYTVFGESSDLQGTIGKKFFNLKVTDVDGNKISLRRAMSKSVLKCLTNFITPLLFIVVAVTDTKQGFHNFGSKTLVVERGSHE